jgi:hypothetical protein
VRASSAPARCNGRGVSIESRSRECPGGRAYAAGDRQSAGRHERAAPDAAAGPRCGLGVDRHRRCDVGDHGTGVGATLQSGTPVTITGTAADTGGGVVGGVEVSVDNGATWHPANGRANWTYSWTPSGNFSTTIRSRAVDDSGNLEAPGASIPITVGSGSGGGGCPCSVWPASIVPGTVADSDTAPVTLGVKFTSDVAGSITGIRFYKGTTNTGTHVGSLWTLGGQLLASATFQSESASGWQQVNFTTAVAITAGTVYVASYFAPNGHYAADVNFFANAGVDAPPLHFLRNGVNGGKRRLYVRRGQCFPELDVQRHQLLGGRRVHLGCVGYDAADGDHDVPRQRRDRRQRGSGGDCDVQRGDGQYNCLRYDVLPARCRQPICCCDRDL